MNTEKMGFKTCLFGGFDRADVVSYIEKLAGERNEYKQSVDTLTEKNEELENSLSKVRADAAQAIQAAAQASKQVEAENAAFIEKAAAALQELDDRYQVLCTDADSAVAATRAQMDMLATQLQVLLDRLHATGAELAALHSANCTLTQAQTAAAQLDLQEPSYHANGPVDVEMVLRSLGIDPTGIVEPAEAATDSQPDAAPELAESEETTDDATESADSPSDAGASADAAAASESEDAAQ